MIISLKKVVVILFGLLIAQTANAEVVAPSNVVSDEYGAVMASLTSTPGDAVNGRKVFMNRKQGNCLACHVNSEMSEQQLYSEILVCAISSESGS